VYRQQAIKGNIVSNQEGPTSKFYLIHYLNYVSKHIGIPILQWKILLPAPKLDLQTKVSRHMFIHHM